MSLKVRVNVHKIYLFLREAMPVVIFLMLVFFGAAILGFQKDNRQLLRDTKRASQNTEVIVSKQDQTLNAIKLLSLDNKLTSKQLGDTIICMLLVPVGQRTTETQDDCRKEAVSRTPASASSGSTQSQPVQPTSPVTPKPTPKPTTTPSVKQPSTLNRLLNPITNLLSKIF